VGAPLASLVEIGALLSAFFVCVGCTTAATRTLYAMGREGALPPWLGRTHSRFRTPANAALTVAALATVWAALVGFGLGTDDLGGEPTTVYYFFATLGTLCVILVYIGLCVAGAVFFRREARRYRILTHLLAPAVGVVLFGAALYGSIYPTPPEPLEMTPYITLAAIVLGVLALGVLRVSRPEAAQRIGSILGEEEDRKPSAVSGAG
jgi:amino acid transporter